MTEEIQNANVEVFVTMPKKVVNPDGTVTKMVVRKKEVDVEYIGYPVEVFVNKKSVFSNKETKKCLEKQI